MKYSIVLSKFAFADLDAIYSYIAHDLRSVENAEAQISRIETEITSLTQMPERYRQYEKEPWCSRGVRIVPVNNYCILYIPDHTKKTVTVLRVVYGRRNLDTILTEYEKELRDYTN